MGSIRNVRPSRSNQPWIEFLDNEIANGDPQTPRHAMAKIFRRSLFSARGCLPSDAALQLDSYYHDTYLPAHPDLKDEDDKGMVAFLSGLYGVVVDLMFLIPYHHGLQYTVIDLLYELRNLPPKEIKVGGKICQIYEEEPVLELTMKEKWVVNNPTDDGDPEEVERRWLAWVNVSAFAARCIEAGFADHFEDSTIIPCMDISKALEEEHPPGIKRNCLIRVAVQYIMIAGTKICRAKIGRGKTEEQQRWLEKWKSWAEKLLELAEQNELEPGLTSEVREAHGTMVALQPHLFKFKR
ncbi:uncharacterized protein F4812DRAFT_416084 [Daldinia caldariorum]|uniref:uncharacterized protein n=1 Tax=Daldinia caldariorum TaxID=326644 RepID=UPI002007928E|nr:uncharacterized protein F4812DRAFT_416084 [Daldinia caldariorum]KAI1471939.1 hypothetical protein F4812DRAFT_416084 [Daldinia caldariorum]